MAWTTYCKFSITYLIVWTYMLLKIQTSNSSGTKVSNLHGILPPLSLSASEWRSGLFTYCTGRSRDAGATQPAVVRKSGLQARVQGRPVHVLRSA